ncbi:hypothetical protein GV828_04160 [Flavobacterium sp. NST-5]|uniref:DUF4890 domain-containing protein n=1 Tax=Flavobacterium ichthyis TaxID=2698827 RepID=A0ABW9ZBC4_9FLAO|nr:hypothetical protein [Flavobacterium ichthyis]NBL64395.1 hypothetical protein [Flavobacterium ichthyis]
MKKMMIAALLMIGMTSFAQEKTLGEKRARPEREHLPQRDKLSPEERNKKQLEKITSELNLTDAQQKEVAKLMAENKAKREAKKEDRQAKMKLMKAEREKEMEANDAKMKKILTADQYAKYQTLKAEKKAKMQDRLKDRKEKKK